MKAVLKSRHHGKSTYRWADNPEERRFAAKWYSAQLHGVCRDELPDKGLLAQLLGDGLREAEPTDRDCMVAATVVQWLGSPVGQSFLSELGYEKVNPFEVCHGTD